MLIPSKHSGYQAGIRLYPGKSKAPPPPDYAAAAIATSQGNLAAAGQNAKANQALARETAAANLNLAKIGTVANRANQYNPYGSLTWERGATDYDPWTQRVNLTPEGQRLLDNQNQLDQSYSDAAIKGFAATKGVFENPNIDQSLLPKAPIDAGTTAQEAMMARLQPTLERNEEALRTRLANQGIGLGSSAYGREMNLQGQQANDLYLQSMAQGINMDAAARERALNEAYTAQSRPLTLINALRTGAQVQNPQFQSYSQQAGVNQNGVQQQFTGGPDLLGAVGDQYNAQLSGVNAKNAATSGMVQGIGQLAMAGATGGLFSDRRMKENIVKIGSLDNGLNLYKFDYKPEFKDVAGHGSYVGVMADEAKEIVPDAVIRQSNGYDMVDYSKVY
jgi:hypothetical protein